MNVSAFQTITQVVKDLIPTIGWGAIIVFLAWAWRKSLVVSLLLKNTHEQSQKAMSQIDQMASNHFPHMETGILDLNKKTEEGNEKLGQIATGIAVLVDRKRK
jgi:hypothetical protein